MTYTASLRTAVGCVHAAIDSLGLDRDPRFREHGRHVPERDAPMVVVACSGGRDSLALAAVSSIVCSSRGLRCAAAIVDHRLQDGSREVCDRAARQCAGRGLEPVRVIGVDVVDDGRGIEACARDARYRALCEQAHLWGACAILLAHTRDDQAETVLMGMLRLNGIDGVAGMPERSVVDGVAFLRPFLSLTRAQTTRICEDVGLSWWDDPTNGDDHPGDEDLPSDYPLRSRVRHSLIPYLSRFTGSDVVDHLARSARLCAVDKDYLDSRADEVAARVVTPIVGACGPEVVIDAPGLADEHEAIRSRVLVRAASLLGLTVSSRHVAAIDALVTRWHGQGAVHLPSKYSAIRQKHVIRLCQDGVHANR